jgi:DNA-directed RNA polymerase subunit RPC12/RpoP
MNYLKEKVAYLKGLAEGMQLNESTNESRLIKAIIEVLNDFAIVVDNMEEIQEQMSDQIDSIDEDLAEIEGIMFDEAGLQCKVRDGNVDIECPHCNEKVSVDENLLDDKSSTILCPHCHKDIEVEWDCGCEDCREDE